MKVDYENAAIELNEAETKQYEGRFPYRDRVDKHAMDLSDATDRTVIIYASDGRELAFADSLRGVEENT